MGSKQFSLTEGYIAWAISMCLPIPGLHRVYLGKTNILYLFPGIGHFLSFFDVFSMPRLVRESNLKLEYKAAMQANSSYINYSAKPKPDQAPKKKQTIEQVVLVLAKKNKGIATPSEVALEGDISIDKAKQILESMVSKGFAEMRVKTSGAIVYAFPDFFDDAHEHDFEDF